MKLYIIKRKSYTFEVFQFLEGFTADTGEPLWACDPSCAKTYSDRGKAILAACNANDHGYIYGDPIVIPVEDKA